MLDADHRACRTCKGAAPVSITREHSAGEQFGKRRQQRGPTTHASGRHVLHQSSAISMPFQDIPFEDIANVHSWIETGIGSKVAFKERCHNLLTETFICLQWRSSLQGLPRYQNNKLRTFFKVVRGIWAPELELLRSVHFNSHDYEHEVVDGGIRQALHGVGKTRCKNYENKYQFFNIHQYRHHHHLHDISCARA
jgi:hypothetical protein